MKQCKSGFKNDGLLIGPLLNHDGVRTSDPVEKADLLLDQFCPIEEEPPPDDDTRALQEEVKEGLDDEDISPLNFPFTCTELDAAMRDLPSRAMGVGDLIHNNMLTNLDQKNRGHLLRTLNLMYERSYVPVEWKCALVVPIPKPKKPPDRSDSFRPISLTSCLAKVMKRMLNNRLKWYLDKFGHLPGQQAGFRAGFSTTDQVVRLETSIMKGFNSGKVTMAVFLDLANAFPSTWWTGLLRKLARRGVRGLALRWISNFITYRTLRIRTNEFTSDERRLTKGVPQGCVLSPLLWNVMMADFPQPPPGCELSLFADDIGIYATVDDPEEAWSKVTCKVT